MTHLDAEETLSPQPSAKVSTGLDSRIGRSAYRWLDTFGLRTDAKGDSDFGNPRLEGLTGLSGDVVATLTDRGVIRACGLDVNAFLQGQLSSDVRQLTATQAQLSSYSTPKGRVLALFTLLRHADAVWLETQADIVETTLKRLTMFVLRSKVTLHDAGSDIATLGLSGPNASTILAESGLPVPEAILGCAEAGGCSVLRRLDAGFPRFTIQGPPSALEAHWPRLSARAMPVGSVTWRLLELLAGVPAVHADTREQHVAQMMNLDTLGGISFTKGCYPGQEIVARLHYLGNLKRRMFVGHADAEPPSRGTAVFASVAGAQAVGEVLDSAPHPDGGQLVQVVLQLSHRDSALHLGALAGPALKLSHG